MRIRCYSELNRLKTFEERFEYLSLAGVVGAATFGTDRYINQRFYTSRQWKLARQKVISRDMGLDLGVKDHEIYDQILVHHMNPITANDIVLASHDILDPRFLITTTYATHNAIHYGDASQLPQPYVERKPGDTLSWRPLRS